MAAGLAHCRLPTPRPLAYTSPSGAASLGRCTLQTAYDSDPAFRASVPSSPAARLGTVCHRLLELAGMGALPVASDPGWRAAFDEAWAAALAEQERERMRNPLEAHWPPPERWPYYAARKVATRRLCERIVSARSSSGPPTGGGHTTLLREQRQEAFGGKLRGRADVIQRDPEPAIEDYKTGTLFDGENGEVKAQYRTQMLLYAVLEHEATGVWPKRATLVPLQGDPVVIEIDPGAAMAAAEAAIDALSDYNRAVDAGTPPIDLASPSPSVCGFCPYAIECPAFWSEAEPSWLEHGVIAVAGQIHDREESRLSTFNVRLERAAGSVGAGDYLLAQLDAERFGAILALPEGAEVAAVWLAGDAAAHHLRATQRTRVATEVSRSAQG
jgi:RecB family exonuclease